MKSFKLENLVFIYKGHKRTKDTKSDWYFGEDIDRQEVVPFAINFKKKTISFSAVLANPERDGHPNLNQTRESFNNVHWDQFEVILK